MVSIEELNINELKGWKDERMKGWIVSLDPSPVRGEGESKNPSESHLCKVGKLFSPLPLRERVARSAGWGVFVMGVVKLARHSEA